MDLSFLWPLVECLGVIVFAMGGYPCCCDADCTRPCASCSGGQGPCEYEIVISGVANADCVGCGDINGTWITPWLEDSCAWNFDLAIATHWPNLRGKDTFGNCNTLSTAILILNIKGGADVRAIEVTAGFNNSNIQWWTTHPGDGSLVECMVTGLNVPVQSGDAACDRSQSTCTVTAIA